MLPWGDMLRAAVAAGLSPDAFWRLSLREWRWLSAGRSDAPDPAALRRLMDEDANMEALNGGV